MEIRAIPLQLIIADTTQPRKHHDEESLRGLADSIRQHGLLNPITVTPIPGSDRYRIVTGERRWRAAAMARLEVIPCIVRSLPEEERLTEQLIENLQREDLQPLEKARAIQQIKQALNLTNREVARRLGLSERTVNHILDLLSLPEELGEAVVSSPNRPAAGQITAKHARFLKHLNQEPDLQKEVAERIRTEQLNTEETEKLVRALRCNPQRAREILGAPQQLREPLYEEILPTSRLEKGSSFREPVPPNNVAQKVLDLLPQLADIQVSHLPESQIIELEEALLSLKMAVESLLQACLRRAEDK